MEIGEETTAGGNTASVDAALLLEYAFLFLEDGKWRDADIYCKKVLGIEPECAEAYLGKLMARMRVKNRKQLADCAESFENNDNYAKIIRFGDESIKAELRGYLACIEQRNRNSCDKETKKRKKILKAAVPVAACLVIALLAFFIFVNRGVKQQLKQANVGDTITFGSYEQDENESNGTEPIEWLVLSKEGNTALLISKYGLEAKPYNTENTGITWETCTLRKWLNGEFLKNTFSFTERMALKKTTVTADKNPDYSTKTGNDAKDKVYLLSITEVNKYFGSDEARMCAPTEHAVKNGAYQNNSYSVNGTGACWWWLRTSGLFRNYVASVDSDGYVFTFGGDVDSVDGCVRPVITLRLL